MLGKCKDEMICDLAEYYHICNYRAIPVGLLATLVDGLREDSRVKSKLAGLPIPMSLFFLIAIYDRVAWLQWSKTADAENGRGCPESVVAKLLNAKQEKQYEVFASGEDFKKRWKEITDGN